MAVVGVGGGDTNLDEYGVGCRPGKNWGRNGEYNEKALYKILKRINKCMKLFLIDNIHIVTV